MAIKKLIKVLSIKHLNIFRFLLYVIYYNKVTLYAEQLQEIYHYGYLVNCCNKNHERIITVFTKCKGNPCANTH